MTYDRTARIATTVGPPVVSSSSNVCPAGIVVCMVEADGVFVITCLEVLYKSYVRLCHCLSVCHMAAASNATQTDAMEQRFGLKKEILFC